MSELLIEAFLVINGLSGSNKDGSHLLSKVVYVNQIEGPLEILDVHPNGGLLVEAQDCKIYKIMIVNKIGFWKRVSNLLLRR